MLPWLAHACIRLAGCSVCRWKSDGFQIIKRSLVLKQRILWRFTNTNHANYHKYPKTMISECAWLPVRPAGWCPEVWNSWGRSGRETFCSLLLFLLPRRCSHVTCWLSLIDHNNGDRWWCTVYCQHSPTFQQPKFFHKRRKTPKEPSLYFFALSHSLRQRTVRLSSLRWLLNNRQEEVSSCPPASFLSYSIYCLRTRGRQLC